MIGRIITLGIASIAFGLTPALAQSSGSTQSAKADQQTQPLPQQIQQKLKAQGFTDVKVVPGSYLVSAKDKQGDPVTMVIGPHSMTMFTVIDNEQAAAPNKDSADQKK